MHYRSLGKGYGSVRGVSAYELWDGRVIHTCPLLNCYFFIQICLFFIYIFEFLFFKAYFKGFEAEYRIFEGGLNAQEIKKADFEAPKVEVSKRHYLFNRLFGVV